MKSSARKILFLFLIIEIILFGFFILRAIKKISDIPEKPESDEYWREKRMPKELLPFEPNKWAWKEVVSNAPWAKRDAHTTEVFNDKFWLLGGWDGIWQKLPAKSPWSGREDLTCLVFQDKIWLIGGMVSSGARENDVWYLAEFL